MTVTQKRLETFKRVAAGRQQGFVVVLEDIHDPHNAMAILRTCDAFGIQDVQFVFAQEKQFNPRKMGKSSSSSANKWLTYKTYTDTETCLRTLIDAGYHTVATTLSETAGSLYTAELIQPKIALILGNEHRGISPTAAALAQQHVIIPMAGFVQSLNVSVTAGILLYEISRQRQHAAIGRTTQAEQELLLSDFLSR